MTINDRKTAMLTQDNTVPRCELCEHYRPHYVRIPEAYVPFQKTPCGHCMEPRCKHRNAWDICIKYTRL